MERLGWFTVGAVIGASAGVLASRFAMSGGRRQAVEPHNRVAEPNRELTPFSTSTLSTASATADKQPASAPTQVGAPRTSPANSQSQPTKPAFEQVTGRTERDPAFGSSLPGRKPNT